MLTTELIKGQEALKGLTDDQIKAIADLSTNATRAEIDKVKNTLFGEIHGTYDEVLSGILGVQKPSGAKSSEFWAEQVKELKKAAANGGSAAEIEKLKGTITDLEEKIKSGKGGEALVRQLEEKNKELAATLEDVRAKYTATEAEWKQKYEAAANEYRSTLVDKYLTEQLAGFKFNDTIPETLLRLAVQNAKQAVLNEYEPVQVDDGKGGKVWQFKKGDAIANNPENGLKPYTGKDLLTPHLADVIDTGRQQPGGGTKPAPGGSKITGDVVDVGQPKDMVEAMTNIKANLRAQGISVTDPRHQKIIDATWEQVVKPMFQGQQ